MFCSTIRLIGSSTALTLALIAGARASDGVRLATVAAENGFTYQWMPLEAGATLLRPGVRIVIRAGRLFYDVNNATPIADSAPRFDGRDIVISQHLAQHLREIARKFPYPRNEGRYGSTSHAAHTPATNDSDAVALTLSARQIPGREAIALSGSGPANVPLTITLSGEISTDLPVVVLSRKTVTTATDGTFFAEMSYNQDAHARTELVATVATLAGAPSAQARALIGGLSPQIRSSGLDDWPKK